MHPPVRPAVLRLLWRDLPAARPCRYVCTYHALGNGCDNSRTLTREALETRVLTGLRDRMMTPNMAAEAMRAQRSNFPRRGSK